MEDYLTGKQKINETISTVLTSLKYKNNNIMLVGSSSIQQIQYYGDYDCITNITEGDTAKECYDEFLKILNNVFSSNYIYFIELKLQTKDEKKQKFYSGDKFKFSDLNKVYNNLDFIKLDLVIWENETYEFIETSIIYLKKSSMDKFDKKEYIKNIKEDIKAYTKEGKYFKVLKRKFLIYSVQNRLSKIKELLPVFNSELGLKYKIISNLEAIKLVEEHHNTDPLLKKRIYSNLHGLGINKDNIDKVIEEYKDDINNKSKKINSRFKV